MEVDQLGGAVLKVIVGVNEGSLEGARVGPRVVEGHVQDVDGSVLQVLRVFAAVPVQTLLETRVENVASFLFVLIELKQEAEERREP